MAELIRVDIIVPDSALEVATGILALHLPQGWEEDCLHTGEAVLRIYIDSPQVCDEITEAFKARLPEVSITREHVAEQDWMAAWREYFTPVQAGSHFLVVAPWMMQHAAEHSRRKAIVIEPKTAFGTGHHFTTALCLGAISELADAGRITAGMRFLDLGTGSGILGIGCAMLGLNGVGADIDLLAVENALENRTINNVVEDFTVIHGGIESVSTERYDLILANILAEPLRKMAADITALLKPEGCLVLSGLLDIQADRVEAIYRTFGLPAARCVVQGDWAGLIWD